MRSLLEREWIRVVGHRDVPGRPAMFGTTKLFLDYFGLKKLDDLPPLADLSDWESLRVQLNLPAVSEDEFEEDSATADTGSLPVLYPVDDVEDDDDEDEVTEEDVADALAVIEKGIPDIENALLAENDADADAPDGLSDDGFEPIEATAWPDPNEDNTVIRALEVDADATMDDDDVDVDASARNA
jgi:segregation and condensation protein B